MNNIDQLKKIIKESNNIVFFGGAGVSVASNIPDFRSSNGLYKEAYKIPVEKILSHSYFIEHPKEFYQFYKDKMIYADALPNDAHKALTELENSGKLKAIITQNIDNLHQLANSKNVIELHGSVYRNHCIDCNKSYDLDTIISATDIPKCTCNGIIKPDVILYDEPLDYSLLMKAANYISNCDTLIVAGTSLLVNPAASLVSYFKGENFVIINKSKTPYDNYANLVIRDSIDQVLRVAISK